MTDIHLWDMETLWFTGNENQHIQTTFRYKSWAEFQECKPYKLWKPYIVSSWSWKHIQKQDFARAEKYMAQDHEKHIMSCQKLLRLHPTQYDKTVFDISNEESVELLQILFISPDRFSEIHRVEMKIQQSDEENVRIWLKSHMPKLWKL